MRIIQDKTEFYIEGQSAVALGKFDGIHKGHEALLSHILEQKKYGLLAVVFTFHPSAAVFFGKEEVGELTTRLEKRAYFENLGVDVLVEFPLNVSTASITAEELGEESGRFNYELVCDLCKRIPRVYLEQGNVVACKDYSQDFE